MNRDSIPALIGFACLAFLATAFLALVALIAPAEAQTSINRNTLQLPTQTITPRPTPNFTPNIGTSKVPPVSTRPTPKPRPPITGGGGGRIIIDLGKITKPKPPARKVYKPKPKKKTVRKPAPRRPARPVALPQAIPQFVAGQVTVLIRNQPDTVEAELAQAFGLSVIGSTPISLLDGRIVTFGVPSGRPLAQIVGQLTADPRVDVAQLNNIYLTVQQRARASGKSRTSAQYALQKLSLSDAHQIAQGRDIPVAVIDTGVDGTHPVLANVVQKSHDAVAQGSASVDEHGTAIAGLIAGRGKVTGVAPQASLLAVRAFYMHPTYKRPFTSTDILLRAFDWAYNNGARVFNMSFTGPYDQLVQKALGAAHDKGIVLVAAAGNGGPKAPPAYPAAYERVIAITATDRKDRLYAHANRGGYLSLAAPGVDVLVPTVRNGYKFSSGTSMAAAHVSGMVALLLEKNPAATSEEILQAIKSSAHDLGPKGHDVQFGAGRADAHASLKMLSGDEVQLSSGQ